MIENDIEKYLVKRVKENDGLCLKFVSPGNRGVPDRICIGIKRLCFVELKAPGKKSRADQVVMQKKLTDRGMTVFSDVDSKEGVEEVIKWLTRV